MITVSSLSAPTQPQELCASYRIRTCSPVLKRCLPLGPSFAPALLIARYPVSCLTSLGCRGEPIPPLVTSSVLSWAHLVSDHPQHDIDNSFPPSLIRPEHAWAPALSQGAATRASHTRHTQPSASSYPSTWQLCGRALRCRAESWRANNTPRKSEHNYR